MMESRGDDYVKTGDYARAVRDYALSLAVDPENKRREEKLEKARARLAGGEKRWEKRDTKCTGTPDFQETEALDSLDYVIEKAAVREDRDLQQYRYVRGVVRDEDEE
jgi:hypothetical protein